jgi:hypothetical protein
VFLQHLPETVALVAKAPQPRISNIAEAASPRSMYLYVPEYLQKAYSDGNSQDFAKWGRCDNIFTN